MAIRTDAMGDYFIRTTNLPTIAAFTLMGWFKISADRDNYSTMISFGASSAPNIYYMGTSGSGTNLHLYNNATETSGTNLSVNAWNHIAMVCNGTGAGNLRAYLNGVLDVTEAANSVTVAQRLQIGENIHGEWFNGAFAALKFYSAALTPDEILQERRYYRPQRTANLNSWYPCVHPTANSNVTDFGGSGFNLTASGTLVVEDGPPITWAPRPRFIWHAPTTPPPDTTITAIPPDAILASSNLTGAVGDVDDDPDSPDASFLTATAATSVTDLRVSFGSPPEDLYGTQNFRLQVRKTTGTPTPTLTAELWQGGTFRATLFTDQAVTSTTGQVLQADWTASQLVSVLDGSDVELRLVSTVGSTAGSPGALPAFNALGTVFHDATMPGTSRPITIPTHTNGDLLVLQVVCRNTENNGTLSSITSAGWTQAGGAGTMYGGAQNARLGFGWKIGDGSETAVNITTTGGTTTDRIVARVMRFTATNGFASPPVANIGTATNGSSTTFTMPSVSPSGTNQLALALMGMAVSTTVAAATGETGGNWTEPVAESAGTNGTASIQVSDQSGGGAISGGTATITTGAWVGIGCSLIPALVAGTPTNTIEIGAIEWNAQYLTPAPGGPSIAGPLVNAPWLKSRLGALVS